MANEAIFGFAVLLAIVHIFSGKLGEHVEKYHSQLLSFSAGLFITYIFLVVMPEVFRAIKIIGDNVFIILVLGFAVFHIAEKYIYQHIKNRKDLMTDLAELHVAGFFADQFVVGMALFFAFQFEDIITGAVIFIPLLIHSFSSAISLQHIQEHFNKNRLLNFVLSIAPIAGVAVALLLSPYPIIYHNFFSFVIGGIIYIAIRDMIPDKDKGDIKFFVFGVIISIAAITASKALNPTALAIFS
ncbi:MAG: hypothetical protein J4224_02025 [Candidatus Diapherotrites archaeon]|uniref:ZIP family metal transporter n=1 Tax=Candidatus Iainarchaeum sp. TaxID=3101447 RepID=A0A7J4IQU6_9ARCH|nr:MAG: hypothetical protein QT03_C0001G1113 [archaeon GW2011_AR10]MBS3059184.1 hypothetical protein [Candidatus Diapherotrites archaeon]HIH07868.1 hypothetical protein [Candidatus Diapherotrites archaeon]